MLFISIYCFKTIKNLIFIHIIRFFILFIVFCSFANVANAGRKHQERDMVTVKVISRKSDCVFNGKKIRYKIFINNTFSNAQEGTVKYEIVNSKNKKLFGTLYNVTIPANGTLTIRPKFKVYDPGFYDLITTVNISDYDDTIKNVFGFKPKEINSPVHKPDDFDKFWEDTKKELAAIEPNYKVEYNHEKSTATHKFYDVTMNSLENVTIHCWLTIPRLPGRYPLIIAIPGYKQKVKSIYVEENAMFCICIRSVNDLIKKNLLIGDLKELCVANIMDKNNYIYRGAIMDCLRSVDFIYSHTYEMGIDTSRVAVSGGSQGGALSLITASFDHRLMLCAADNPIFCDFHNYLGIASTKTPNEFPFYDFKLTKIPWPTLLKTLDYFDVQNFVPNLKCPCLFAIGTRDPIAPPNCIYATYNKLSDKTKKMSEINVLNIGHAITSEYMVTKNLWIDENIISTSH